MPNPFITGTKEERDIDTAIIYDRAIIADIKTAIAYTDGKRLFINTEENLKKILPAYSKDFLKWTLWHEKFHIELNHHSRFRKYLDELKKKDTEDEFQLTGDEVNIIMDILVHDSLSKMFPELVETAVANLLQMRNRNSLGYTFKTYNLEDMLDEYKKHKKENKEEKKEGDTKTGDSTKEKEHSKGDSETKSHTKSKDDKPEEKESSLSDEHDKTDWSKLDELDHNEFISERDADRIENAVNELKRKKLKLGRLTQKLNGLATTKRSRTYRLPSMISMGDGCIFKGKTPGKTELYLVFDASGSMSGEMNTFKEIISKSIPQAMKCPCEWFAGWDIKGKSTVKPYKRNYYKGIFTDFMNISACDGYNDDGDRTIELCFNAEQAGFTPIGVTDGGGQISWSEDKLKQLKKTILVGQNSYWLTKCKEINPNIQVLHIDL